VSNLTEVEKRYFEDLFNSRSGYVLDFSDATFAEFFINTVQIDIDGAKYGGQSKAKRLRSFWEQEPDGVVGKALAQILGIWVHQQSDREAARKDDGYLQAKRAVARLLGQNSMNEEEGFLAQAFVADLRKLNLGPGLLPILENRLNEIRLCIKHDVPLAAVILCGSMLEGLLLNAALQASQKFNQSKSSPKDKSGKVVGFQDWSLSSFIDVAHDLGILSLDVKTYGHDLRGFRNFIHPYHHMASKFMPDPHTAKISLQVLLAAIADLGGKRK
jgi:hypothetical protein